MKKLVYFIVFITFLTIFSGKISAQNTFREPNTISQKADDGVLVAYPNPARDYIVVKSKDTFLKVKSVIFYSILGVKVLQVNVNMNSGEINIEKLRTGKYLMRYIMSDNTQRITQIIKQ